MAGSAGARRSCCRGASPKGKAAALQSCTHRRGRSAAMVKISNDRKSGEGRSARLEWRPSRGEKGGRCTIRVLDPANRKRHGQVRRLRQQRSRGTMDRGADRAVIVGVADRLLCRGRRGRRPSGSETATGAPEVAQMNVAKRERDLQRQREQREPRASPQPCPHPPHH